jgi:hypothetical protein
VRQRDRQHETVVVVGVLTDDVDPAGCRPDTLGFGAEAIGECVGRSLGGLLVGGKAHATTTPPTVNPVLIMGHSR